MNTARFAAAFAVAASLLAPNALLAQTPPPPAHHPFSGLMSRLHAMHSHNTSLAAAANNQHLNPASAPGSTRMVGTPGVAGQIIGDKKSHVFHLPGDKGALPAPQNRVYFASAAQAQGAGYRQAGLPGGHGTYKPARTSRHMTNAGTAHAGASGVPAR